MSDEQSNPYTASAQDSASAGDNSAAVPVPRIWPCFMAIVFGLFLAILFQGIMAGALAGMLLSQGVTGEKLAEEIVVSMTAPGLFLLTLVIGQAGFAISTLLAGRLSPEPMMQRLGFKGTRLPAKLYLLSMLGSIFILAIAIGLVLLLTLILPGDGSVEKVFEKMTPLWGVAFVVLIAFLPGFIEETLFRGYIQTRFLKRWSPVTAILASSVLFALVHITPHAILVALPLGIWFGYLAWRTNSIGPGIACHAFVNGGINIWRLIAKFADLSDTVVYVCNGVFVLIGIIAFVMAWKMLATLPEPEKKLATIATQN